jgi:hypothetical protein
MFVCLFVCSGWLDWRTGRVRHGAIRYETIASLNRVGEILTARVHSRLQPASLQGQGSCAAQDQGSDLALRHLPNRSPLSCRHREYVTHHCCVKDTMAPFRLEWGQDQLCGFVCFLFIPSLTHSLTHSLAHHFLQVYIAGAGPVGLASAASCHLLVCK